MPGPPDPDGDRDRGPGSRPRPCRDRHPSRPQYLDIKLSMANLVMTYLDVKLSARSHRPARATSGRDHRRHYRRADAGGQVCLGRGAREGKMILRLPAWPLGTRRDRGDMPIGTAGEDPCTWPGTPQ